MQRYRSPSLLLLCCKCSGKMCILDDTLHQFHIAFSFKCSHFIHFVSQIIYTKQLRALCDARCIFVWFEGHLLVFKMCHLFLTLSALDEFSAYIFQLEINKCSTFKKIKWTFFDSVKRNKQNIWNSLDI